jgi:hypothetical protein
MRDRLRQPWPAPAATVPMPLVLMTLAMLMTVFRGMPVARFRPPAMRSPFAHGP